MNKIFFTSDLHIGHDKDFIYAARGFSSIFEHDKAIVSNWNSFVEDSDLVYVLGDLMLGDNHYGKSIFNQLNGRKIIIRGNHDTDNRIKDYPSLRGVEEVKLADVVEVNKQRFFLCHYPTITGGVDDKPLKKHLISLSGHTHSKEVFVLNNPYMYNVALDAHAMLPVSAEVIISDIKDKLSAAC